MQAILIAKREQERGKIETQFMLKVTDPQDKDVIVQNFNLKMEEGHRRSRLRVNFSIPIVNSGEHVVRIECAEHPVSTVIFVFSFKSFARIPGTAPHSVNTSVTDKKIRLDLIHGKKEVTRTVHRITPSEPIFGLELMFAPWCSSPTFSPWKHGGRGRLGELINVSARAGVAPTPPGYPFTP